MFTAVLLISGGAAQEIDLNLDLDLFGGSDDSNQDQQTQPEKEKPDDSNQGQQTQTDEQEQSDSSLDRDHSGRDVEDDPITSQKSESESSGVMGSISGFVSSIFG